MLKKVDSKQDFVKLEHEVLDFWSKHKIFQKLQKKNAGKKSWSFLDGPITANNPMGVHHAWGRTLKDAWQRYKAMQGFDERFQNGFDCQGLWVEVEVEKDLGFKNKKDIEKYGIDKFVTKCKERVLKYSKIQTNQSIRLGQWMDWDNSYYTMSDENNYAIWHFLKKCYEKKYLYKGIDSVPWCPRCGTAISQHEILTEEYKELTHKAVFFKLPIKERAGEQFLVWTTTPWTIPANVALAVNPEFDYGLYEKGGAKLIMVTTLSRKVLGKDWKKVTTVPGKDLVGLHYTGPFDNLGRVQKARSENEQTFHSVVSSKDLVTDEEGTGIVHIAPGAGTEDFRMGKEEKLPVIDVIDEAANYLEDLGDFTGQNAKDKPEIILNYLKKDKSEFFVKIEEYKHRYPTCWRCKSELVWRVVDEWYISMDELRHQMMAVTKKINWIPEFGLDREIDWLKNMHDWLISKKRYWGLTLPIWECACGHFEVIGSKEELKEKATAGWDEFEGNSPHRPWVDKVKIKCDKCGKKVSRIPDVGSPWLDAGIVPYSTIKYFSDKPYWKKWFPPKFICESFPGQFKNWFYSLIAMSTVLEDTNPFATVLGYALVKDDKGEEMHKSKGNAIWFDDAAEEIGVDVMRWLYCGQQPELNLRFGYQHTDEVRRKILLLWNVYVFFVTYANIDKPELVLMAKPPKHKLDRWILSALHDLVKITNESMDKYDSATVVRRTEKFVDDLANWYVRRSRRRFWKSASDKDKAEAYNVLYTVLLTLSKLLAPFIPFFTESMYGNLKAKSDPESVHLCDYPKSDDKFIDEKLNDQMDAVLKIVRLTRAIREKEQVGIRQPLTSVRISGLEVRDEELEKQITEEINVKSLSYMNSADLEKYATKEIKPNYKILGTKYGAEIPKIEAAVKTAYEITSEGDLKAGEFTLSPEEFSEQFSAKEGFGVAEEGSVAVVLDLNVTPELELEGLAREIIRVIQDMRKEMDYNVADRILVEWTTSDSKVKKVFDNPKLRDYIGREVLATEILETKISDRISPDLEKETKFNGSKIVNIGIKEASAK
ncbi:isoleucine--tRNA ligase [Patescibacteria group bacterium]